MSQHNKTRTNVEIYGHQYTIVGEENKSHVRMVASIVDDKMREINEINPYLDINKLAVLTAVNIVDEHLKLKNKYDDLLQKLQKEEDKRNND